MNNNGLIGQENIFSNDIVKSFLAPASDALTGIKINNNCSSSDCLTEFKAKSLPERVDSTSLEFQGVFRVDKKENNNSLGI